MAKKRQRRARGTLYLTQDKASGIWWATGSLQGHGRVRRSLSTHSREHAEHKLQAVIKEMLDTAVHGRKVVSTFNDCVDHYLAIQGARGGGTVGRYLPKLREAFGKMKAKDINSKLVQDYALRTMPNTQNNTRNTSIVNPMVTVLRSAAKAGLCDVPMFQKFPAEKAVVRAAPQQFINDFLARSQRQDLRTMVALLTTAGCRCVEALRLDWTEIDTVACEAVLPPHKTKNGEARTIHFPEAVGQMLEALKARGLAGPFKNWSDTRVVIQEIRNECKRLGLEVYGTHELGRHAFAERLLGQGRTLKEVAAAGGWKDYSVLNSRYGHLEKSKSAEMVKEAGAAMFRTGLRVVKGGKDG